MVVLEHFGAPDALAAEAAAQPAQPPAYLIAILRPAAPVDDDLTCYQRRRDLVAAMPDPDTVFRPGHPGRGRRPRPDTRRSA